MANYPSGSHVISKEYRLRPEKRAEMLDDLRIFIIKNFHNVHNYGDLDKGQDHFKFRYHKRDYVVTLKDKGGKIVRTGGYPQTVAEGLVELVVNFPNENKSNKRLVNRLNREINVPNIGIDMSGY